MAGGTRFGLQLGPQEGNDPIELAHRAEAAGFDVLLTGDHIGTGLSPFLTLAAVATATRSIRLGTFVAKADLRNPVELAGDAVTLDRLSNGRFELGIGAGHTTQEYSAVGREMQPAIARKRALFESFEILRCLLDGEQVDFTGR